MSEAMSLYRETALALGVRVLENEPLGPYTTMKVGGPARWLFAPKSAEQAARLWAALAAGPLPVRMLGAGSNVIVVDEGISAAVIVTTGLRGDPVRIGETAVRVPAGAGVPGLVRWSARHGLAGLEFAEGIPARVGGAVAMNAGANRAEFKDVLTALHVASRSGEIVTRAIEAGEFGYRTSAVRERGELVLGATLQLEPDDPAAILARVREHKARRRATQPLWERSAGCVFANWPEQPVGALVERLGLKGTRVGGAEVSTLHGNFIVNRGDATAADVLALIDTLRERLGREVGGMPRLEVQVWSDDA